VLDLSRIESGEMAVSQEAVALSVVIEEASMMVSPLVTEAGIEVIVSSNPAAAGGWQPTLFGEPSHSERAEEVWVRADAVRLRQVLVNLLSNAVKYNRPGGRVVLSWRVLDACCEVRIEDTGHGIAPDKLVSLFEPFNRLGAEDSQVQGTGIGLVLSRQLVEMMGGDLRITSTLGEGTTAMFVLQVASAPAASAAARPVLRQRIARAAPALNVMYAEDNEVNAELLRQIVTLRPFVSLRVAENGNVALLMARADPPDLMLVDMNLGDMTGIELAHALHKDRATRQIRLVALSADALPEQIEGAMRCGFEAYLTKPIDFGELLALLDAHSLDA
jgi:CheY-like chemotaxis protein